MRSDRYVISEKDLENTRKNLKNIGGSTLIVFVTLVGFFVSNSRSPAEIFIVFLLFICFFGLPLYALLSTVINAPSLSLSTDKNGIWNSQAGKQHTFVSWDEITRLRRRRFSSSVDIIDTSGCRRLTISSKLKRFKILAESINRYIEKGSNKADPRYIEGKQKDHIQVLVASLPIIALGIYTIYNSFDYGGYYLGTLANLVGIILIFYFTASVAKYFFLTPLALAIKEDSFVVKYLGKEIGISFSDIQDIEVVEVFQEQTRRRASYRYREVRIHLKKRGKSINVGSLYDDPYRLLGILNRSMRRR